MSRAKYDFVKLCVAVRELNRSAKQRGFPKHAVSDKMTDNLTIMLKEYMPRSRCLRRLLKAFPNAGCSTYHRGGGVSFNITRTTPSPKVMEADWLARRRYLSASPLLREWFQEHIQHPIGLEIRLTFNNNIYSTATSMTDRSELVLTMLVPSPDYMYNEKAYHIHEKLEERVSSMAELVKAMSRMVRSKQFQDRALAEFKVTNALLVTMQDRADALEGVSRFQDLMNVDSD